MGLRDLKFATTKISLDDEQFFEVRGISMTDLMAVVAVHGPQLSIMFSKLTEERNEELSFAIDNDATRKMLYSMSTEFPEVVAAAIALASDAYDEEGVRIARQLPFPVQVQAVEEIFKLTFRSEGEVKKLIESLTRMAVAASGALVNAKMTTARTSLAGIGGSDGK